MSDFAGNEELLRDFLTEASELLAQLDNHLVDLERAPGDAALLNSIFRDFHTIKGGAGFLGATELVQLCHLTESLFDRLRNGALALTPALLDLILGATAQVRTMFASLAAMRQPQPAPAELLVGLDLTNTATRQPTASGPSATAGARAAAAGPDWAILLAHLTGHSATGATTSAPPTQEPARISGHWTPPSPPGRRVGDEGRDAGFLGTSRDVRIRASLPPAAANPHQSRRATDEPTSPGAHAGRRDSDKVVAAKDTTIRIATARLDQVLNLSGEIGLAKNRLNCLRSELGAGRSDAHTLRALDEAIGQLDLLVADLQNAVMKTRMQPVGRLFQKYPRLARDLARQLGKEVDLQLGGEDTELDRSMLEELSDPLLHLVRNAIDHGLELPEERIAAGKAAKGSVTLNARYCGDRILIEIADDGRGMRADVLRRKAIEKGLLDPDSIRAMDDRQALQLIFLPGFSTKDEISSVSGRGVGMDVVKTNIQKLNGRIDIASVTGADTTISIALPLTLAILPVLVVRLAGQPFALPLTLVREIVRIDPAQIQSVAGKATLIVRDEVLPVRSAAALLGLPSQSPPAYGVVLQTATANLVLTVDGFLGRDDVVIKPLEGVKPKGIAGATLSGDGSIVLVLDLDELFTDTCPQTLAQVLSLAA